METKTTQVAKTNNNDSKKPFDKKLSNGEGVKVAFENAVKGISKKLDALWINEKGKKYLVHLIFSFLPANDKKVFKIGKFEDHNKYKNLAKVCSLTGFAVSDSSFTMDEATKKHFEEKHQKANKLVHAIPCSGSVESDKILSNDALVALNEWVRLKVVAENCKGEFSKLLTASIEKGRIKEEKNANSTKSDKSEHKPVTYHKPENSTYTLADKFDFSKLKLTDSEK